MRRLTRADLRSLEDYELVRAEFRQRIAAVKAPRRVPVGEFIALTFENRDTVLYQVQEMLRAERIFEPHRIQEELDIYNELVPADGELSATLFIEIGEMEELRRRLPELVGIEECVWLELGPRRIHAQAEPGRSTETRTATVHYLRFPVGKEAAAVLRDLAQPARLHLTHRAYQAVAELSPETRQALAEDLETP